MTQIEAGDGASVYLEDQAIMSALNMTFDRNVARRRAGVLLAKEGSYFTLANSTISHSQAPIGAAIFGDSTQSEPFRLSGVTFSDNAAT